MYANEKLETITDARRTNWQTEMSDEELLDEYQLTRDDRLFEELVRRHEKGLYGYLRRYLGHDALAEDVYQTTFLNVHRNLDQFETGRRFKPWLYRIATNRAIDATRRNRVRRMASLDVPRAGSFQDIHCTYGDLLIDDNVEPISAMEQRERQAWVHDAVHHLPKRLRVVVRLILFRGLKYREVADRLALPLGTVKSRMHVAMAELKSSWHEREKRDGTPKNARS